MNFLLEIILNTPFWVYLIFLYIIYAGIKATKTRKLKLKSLFFAPLIVSLLALHTLLNPNFQTILLLVTWSIILIITFYFGRKHTQNLNISINKKDKQLLVPGSYLSLVILLLIFSSKYFYGVTSALNQNFANSPLVLFIMITISALSLGVIWGRFTVYLEKYLKET